MKKALIIFLIPIFLFATTIGVTMVSHYCGGKLAEKGFNVKPCCKDVNKGGCCKTKSEHLKVKDNFVKANTDIHLNSILAFEKNFIVFEFKPLFKENAHSKGYWDKAPPIPDTHLYILFRSLII